MRPADETFRTIVETILAVEDPAERAYLISRLFELGQTAGRKSNPADRLRRARKGDVQTLYGEDGATYESVGREIGLSHGRVRDILKDQ